MVIINYEKNKSPFRKYTKLFATPTAYTA